MLLVLTRMASMEELKLDGRTGHYLRPTARLHDAAFFHPWRLFAHRTWMMKRRTGSSRRDAAVWLLRG